jgi:hypothetical protein
VKKEDDGAVPLSLPQPPIAAATVARPCRLPHMMIGAALIKKIKKIVQN